MKAKWDKVLRSCSEHGSTQAINSNGVGMYEYCIVCLVKKLKYELALAHEEIGLLKGHIAILEEIR